MPKYYVNTNAQSSGDHEVHAEDCVWLEKAKETIYVGFHSACRPAVMNAKKLFAQSNGCATCSKDCHTQ